jgi:outer membrane protein OmpA-like peptidoglycan-associated protein
VPAMEPNAGPSRTGPLIAARPAPAPDPEPHRLVLHFATNRASLTPSHKAVVASAMGDLRRAERIVIVGRTDDTGGELVNQSLAFARALAIRDHLLDLAPDLPARIAIDAKGRCCYAAANDSADGRSRNRRVELVFTTPPEAAP